MTRRPLLLALGVVSAALLAACGSESLDISKDDPLYGGAELFSQRCAGCHTFDPAGAQGSAESANNSERKDGPNFNVRQVQYEEALYAIRNGGFSSGPMPQNIVVGREAREVACFVATYSGREATAPRSPGAPPAGAGPDDCADELK
jgi:mono/diheme cytochrome c family protein